MYATHEKGYDRRPVAFYTLLFRNTDLCISMHVREMYACMIGVIAPCILLHACTTKIRTCTNIACDSSI